MKLSFELLQYFADRGSPATISEIAEYFEWPRSSTVNQVETLCHLGLLHEPVYRQGFYPTSRLLDLASDLVRVGGTGSEFETLVQAIATESGETAAIAAMAGHHGVFINVAESPNPIRYFADIGQRIPLHATSAGRALLSQLSDRDLRAFLGRVDYVRYSDNTLMSAEAVIADIEASRLRGYFINDNGFARDLIGVAVPLRMGGRNLSVVVAGPIFRVGGDIERLASLLDDAIARVTDYKRTPTNE